MLVLFSLLSRENHDKSTKQMQVIEPNNGRLWSEQRSGNAISYHGPGLVNMSGVSVTNVKHFMGCVAIINTPISSV